MGKSRPKKYTFWRKYYGNVVFATGKQRQRQRQGGNWGNWSGMRGSVGGKMIPCKHWNPRKKRKSEQLWKDHVGHFAFCKWCKWCNWEFGKNRNCPAALAIIGSLATSSAAVTWDCQRFVQDFLRFSPHIVLLSFGDGYGWSVERTSHCRAGISPHKMLNIFHLTSFLASYIIHIIHRTLLHKVYSYLIQMPFRRSQMFFWWNGYKRDSSWLVIWCKPLHFYLCLSTRDCWCWAYCELITQLNLFAFGFLCHKKT